MPSAHNYRMDDGAEGICLDTLLNMLSSRYSLSKVSRFARDSLDMLGFVSNELPASWRTAPSQSNYGGPNLRQNPSHTPPRARHWPFYGPCRPSGGEEERTLGRGCHS
ncbi:hypothetical protein MHYP_G00146850 [Metynnis hypsauchen]